MDESIENIAKLIRDLRTQHGWSLRTLEAESGVCYSQIFKIESGASIPTIDVVNNLLAPFGKKLAIVDLELPPID